MPANDQEFPVTATNVDTPRAAAGIVLGALVALWLLRRGFRGISAGGVNIGIK